MKCFWGQVAQECVKTNLGLGRVLRGWVRDLGTEVNIRVCACTLLFFIRVRNEKRNTRGALMPSRKLFITIEVETIFLAHDDFFR